MAEESELEVETEESPSELPSTPGFEELLAHLKESRGFDFAGYKRGGLERRLLKRAHTLGLPSLVEYVDYLEVHPEEFDGLFNAILINVTSFFRDPPAWHFLAQEVVPRIIESKRDGSPIRIWSAGCATGQEAYSIAMLLAQALGLDEFAKRVKIYATDMDDEALAYARLALYTSKELTSVPADLAAAYFERAGTKHAFRKEARRSVIFGRHNLLYDAPISRIDLLLCRNTLMYFNADAQARILGSAHFALTEAGVLFLGKAEMLLTQSGLFVPLDLKRRLFSKVTQSYPRGRIALLNALPREAGPQPAFSDEARQREAMFEVSPIAQIGINSRNIVTLLNAQARKLLEMTIHDLGVPIQETVVARRIPGLRSLIDQANVERRTAQFSAYEVHRGDGPMFLDITALPLVDAEGNPQGVHLSFAEVTTARRMQQELQQATQELEGAYEELQATSEELETTNEELQSTVEELETTNEELQSTNEELETTNEELQSTNDELQGMNDVLRVRTNDLGRLNLHLETILTSLQSAVVVLDAELHVQVWSSHATALWGLRPDEVVGRHFFGLDIGLPVDTLRTEINACVDGEREYQEILTPAINRRGKSIQCAVKIRRLMRDGQLEGVLILMDERDD